MKYLCLCYYDTAKFAQLLPEQLAEIGPACKPHDATLRATGKVVVQGSLADVASKHAADNYGEHVGMAVEVRQCESFD